MDRTLWLRHWHEAAVTGLWAAPWNKLLDGLTPEQAATRPQGRDASGRNSIWQIVNHMAFWREEAIRRVTTGKSSPDDVVQKHNFEAPAHVDAAGWEAARRRLQQSYDRVREVAADEKADFLRVQFVLAHDCYHFGQIAYIRALLGLPAVE